MSSLTSLYGGGGGGTPVNSIARLFVGGQTQYTDPDGGVWLKTGNITDQNISLYPDATVSPGIEGTFFVQNYYNSSTGASHTGFRFNNDGTKMYKLSTASSDTIYEFDLSTPFDISTASYNNKIFQTYAQDNNGSGIEFNSDGTKMYLLGRDSNTIYEYNLSTAFSITSASYSNVSFSLVGQIASTRGMRFNNDGSKLYLTNTTTLYQYSLSTPFDISTLSYDNISVSNVPALDLYFTSDGTRLYTLYSANVTQFNLSTAYDLSTISNIGTFSAGNTPYSIEFNSDATKMYLADFNDRSIYEYDMYGNYVGLITDTGTYDYIKLK